MKNKFNWKSRITAGTAIILGTVLLFQIFYIIPYIHRREVKITQARQEEIVRSITCAIERDLNRKISKLTILAGQPEFLSMNIADEQKTINALIEGFQQFETLSVFNAHGKLKLTTSPALSANIGKTYSGKAIFTKPFIQKEVCVGEPEFVRSLNAVIAAVFVPIISKQGKPVGVLSATFKLNHLIDIVQNYPVPKKTVLRFVDRKGLVIAHSGKNLFALKNGPLSLTYSAWPIIQAAMANELTRSQKYEHEGTSYLGTFSILKTAGWGIVIDTHMNAIIAEAKVFTMKLLFANIALFAIALTAAVILGQQITISQERTQTMLAKSEDIWHSIVNSIPNIVLLVDIDGTIQFANRTLGHTNGMSQTKEVIGKKVCEYVKPEYRPIIEQTIKHVFETGRSAKYQSEGISSNNSSLWHETQVGPVKQADKVVSVVFVITDISERKKSENEMAATVQTERQHIKELQKAYDSIEKSHEASLNLMDDIRKEIEQRKIAEKNLFEEHAFSENLIQTAPVIILVIKKNKIVRFNPYFEQISGYKLEELRNKDCIDTLLPEYERNRIRKVLDKTATDTQTNNIVNPIITKDGRELIIEWQNKALKDDRGKVIGILSIGQDITQRQLLQQELIQTEKLAAIGELVSGIAHEINNPLTSVVGFSKLLQDETELPDKEKEQIDTIYSESIRIKKIISNLLSFARKKEEQNKPINVNTSLRKILEMREYELKVNHIKVTAKLDDRIPLVKADSQRIMQVFLNIINNAEQAMTDARGEGNLTVITSSEENTVRVEFTDDGLGISKENINKVFDPFFTTKTVGKGTGLGLSVSYGIIKSLNGNIFVESSGKGKGTTFIIEIPAV